MAYSINLNIHVKDKYLKITGLLKLNVFLHIECLTDCLLTANKENKQIKSKTFINKTRWSRFFEGVLHN